MEGKICPLNLGEKNLRMLALFTAGILAGENYGLNMYAVPLLKTLKDPEERKTQFTKLNSKGKNIALSSSLLLTGTLAYLYYKTKDRGLFCPMTLSLMKIPVTLIFMKNKYNDALMEYEGDDMEKVDELLDGWKMWHWVRVGTDTLAFVAVICTVIYKKE